MADTETIGDQVVNNISPQVAADVAFFTAGVILFCVVVAIVAYIVWKGTFKDKIRAYNILNDGKIIITYHNAKVKSFTGNNDNVETALIFRNFRSPLRVMAYLSEHMIPIHGKRSYSVDYVVFNKVWSPLRPDINKEKMTNQYQIAPDMSNIMANEIVESDAITESKSTFKKFERVLIMLILVGGTIAFLWIASHTMVSIHKYAPACPTLEPPTDSEEQPETLPSLNALLDLPQSGLPPPMFMGVSSWQNGKASYLLA